MNMTFSGVHTQPLQFGQVSKSQKEAVRNRVWALVLDNYANSAEHIEKQAYSKYVQTRAESMIAHQTIINAAAILVANDPELNMDAFISSPNV